MRVLPIVVIAGLLLSACSVAVGSPAEAAEEGVEFTGRVLTPTKSLFGNSFIRKEHFTRSVVGARVVVLEGLLSGSSFITDDEGRYRIPNLVGDQVRVRVEKKGFLTKEVTVYRSAPTFPPGDNRYEVQSGDDVQATPGNILIGLPWPSEIKFMQEGNRAFVHVLGQVIEVESDLLLVVDSSFPEGFCGAHGWGIIMVKETNKLGCLIHEIAHSHQVAWTLFHLDVIWGARWTETPEGEAFLLAKQEDLAEHGPWGFDNTSYYRDTPHENAAEVFVEWFGVRDPEKFRHHQPNRAAWADEWVTKLVE